MDSSNPDTNRPRRDQRIPQPLPDPLANKGEVNTDPLGPGQRRRLDHAALSYQQLLRDHPHDNAALDRYWDSFAGSSYHAALFRDLHRADPQAARQLAETVTEFPEIGFRFGGFDLLRVLGEGAFGRVYLAAQTDLAHRHVALKVSVWQAGEPEVLARLQHTNVVPVYSVHRVGALHAVCMPYLGATTLADVIEHLQSQQTLPESGRSLAQVVRNHRDQTIVPAEPCTTPLRGPAPAPRAPVAEPARDAPPPGRTNALLERLERLSYVDAVLWLIARLADGLAHAHERGILHCDLKPANVLLTDDGEPMLLDFNLAVDTAQHLRGHAAVLGGTLPYMAPEHLELFRDGTRQLDARSDVYSLGVILYKMLTGQHPFPVGEGELSEVLPAMLAERRVAPPVRCWNRAVSPAVEAIVKRCLEPDPARRYPSAQALLEDIECHRADLPLKHASNPSLVERAAKWRRRHPRLASSTTLGAAAALVMLVLIGLLIVRGQRLARLEAAQNGQQFRDETRAAQLGVCARVGERDELIQGLDACRQALGRYRVLDDPHWRERPAVVHLPDEQRARLPEQVADLLLLTARGLLLLVPPDADAATRRAAAEEALQMNARAEACYAVDAVPRAVWEQRGQLYEMLGDEGEARALRERAAALPLRTSRDHYWSAVDLFLAGQSRAATPLLEETVRLDPQHLRAWFVLARCHDAAGRDADAVACYGSCIALEPEYPWSHFNRGLAHLRLGQHEKARRDFDRTLALKPGLADAYINRALTQQGLGHHQDAAADLTQALELGAPQTRIYFMRARVWDRLGERDKAKADRAEGLRREPGDEKSWIARGLARLPSDPHEALSDFEAALRLNPRSVSALQNRAHVLADRMPAQRTEKERLDHTREAVAALDQALVLAPDYVPARSGRGVLLARLGQRVEALADVREVLKRDTSGRTLYEAGCVYALTTVQQADDRLEAFRLLSAALRQGFGFDLIENDADLKALRSYPEFRRLIDVARALKSAQR